MERTENVRRAPLGRTFALRDGRRLGFAEFGPAAGQPVFFFHGGGSSRLTRHPDDSILDELDVRLITMDRPGVGLSDPQPRRRLLNWPDDVEQLADSLHIDRFAALGWSAGGPHALACAYKIPHRLRAVGVMSGLAPLHWPGLMSLVLSAGFRLSSLAVAWARCGADLAEASRLVEREKAPAEVRAIHRQRVRDMVRAREWQRGVELAMLACPWGFRLHDVSMKVHLWYGSRDNTTPLYMARYMERVLPAARLTVWPGEGHHVGFTHWREVIGTMVR